MLTQSQIESMSREEKRKLLLQIASEAMMIAASMDEGPTLGMSDDVVLTVAEVSTRLRMSEDEVRRRAGAKRFPFMYRDVPGGRWKASKNGLEEYLAKRTHR